MDVINPIIKEGAEFGLILRGSGFNSGLAIGLVSVLRQITSLAYSLISHSNMRIIVKCLRFTEEKHYKNKVFILT